MSWGERSCGNYNKGCEFSESEGYIGCKVDCPHYIWDGMTHPDSSPSKGTAVSEPMSLTAITPMPGNPRHLNRAQRRALVKVRKKNKGGAK